MTLLLLLLVSCIPVRTSNCRSNGYSAGYAGCEDGENYSDVRSHIGTDSCLEAWDEGYANGVADCQAEQGDTS